MRWVKIPRNRLPKKFKLLPEEEADKICLAAGFFFANYVVVKGPKGGIYALVNAPGEINRDPLRDPRYVYQLLRK